MDKYWKKLKKDMKKNSWDSGYDAGLRGKKYEPSPLNPHEYSKGYWTGRRSSGDPSAGMLHDQLKFSKQWQEQLDKWRKKS